MEISPSAATFRDHRYAQMSTVFLHHLDHRRALRVHRHRGCSRRNRKDSIFYLPRDLRDLSRIGPNGGGSEIFIGRPPFSVTRPPPPPAHASPPAWPVPRPAPS